MNALSDRFATWDAAYVLGALSPVERREYEEHLAGCPACQAAVSELAGLPGLLAQVPPEDAALLAAAPGAEVLDDGPPPDLLARIAGAAGPALAADPHRSSGRRPLWCWSWPGSRTPWDCCPSGPRAAASRVRVRPADRADRRVDVVPVEDGTKIEVQCVYGESNEPSPGGGYGNADYTIYVVDRDGNATEIKGWKVKPNRTMTPDGPPGLKVRQIEAVEIRYAPTTRRSCARPPLTPR